MIILPRPGRHGYTLVELVAVMVMLGIALGITVPVIGRSLDGLRVRTARDHVVLELARARLLARLHGGAVGVLDAEARTTWIESLAGDTLAGPVHLGVRHDVRIDVGGESTARVVYDRFGIGRLANRSIRLTRNDAEARLTISSYGRVRAW